jgi:hypothetical protein
LHFDNVPVIQRNRREDLLVERSQPKDTTGRVAGQREKHGTDSLGRGPVGLRTRRRRVSTCFDRAKVGTKLTGTFLERPIGELADVMVKTIDLGQRVIVRAQVEPDR